MKQQNTRIEGYWRRVGMDGCEYDTQYPMPVSQETPVSVDFIEKLKQVEKKAHKILYRGDSICRCCSRINGGAEYKLNGWSWPDGFMHYLKEHNVHPSSDFVTMIEKETSCE